MMSVFISIVNLTERLRELEWACVPPAGRQDLGISQQIYKGDSTPDVRVLRHGAGRRLRFLRWAVINLFCP